MEDDASVGDIRAGALGQGRVRVVERGRVGRRAVDLAVLPAQVTLLARLRPRRIARRVLPSDVLVEMREGAGAVAVFGDRGDVDVIY